MANIKPYNVNTKSNDSNGCATTATDDFNNGLNYIDGQLQQNKPVIVAVDYKEKTLLQN